MAFCTSCGKQLPEGSNVCSACGAQINLKPQTSSAAQAEQAAQTPPAAQLSQTPPVSSASQAYGNAAQNRQAPPAASAPQGYGNTAQNGQAYGYGAGNRNVYGQYAAPQQPQQPQQPQRTTCGLAKASKGVGIASFFIGGITFAILALIMAISSKADTGGVLSDDARVGKICGIVNICIRAFFVILAIVFYVGIVIALVAGVGSGVFGEIAEKIRDLFEEIF